jgi:hypothetical protein
MIDRQSVIEQSINIENLISILITHHFFPGNELNIKFLQQVMYDPSANTGFKVSVFSKCYPDEPKASTERIRRIFNIRNIFAHSGPNVLAFVDPDRADSDPHDELLDFEGLEREFFALEAEARQELVALMDTAGVPAFEGDPRLESD